MCPKSLFRFAEKKPGTFQGKSTAQNLKNNICDFERPIAFNIRSDIFPLQ